jgi:hypothetical protein
MNSTERRPAKPVTDVPGPGAYFKETPEDRLLKKEVQETRSQHFGLKEGRKLRRVMSTNTDSSPSIQGVEKKFGFVKVKNDMMYLELEADEQQKVQFCHAAWSRKLQHQ